MRRAELIGFLCLVFVACAGVLWVVTTPQVGVQEPSESNGQIRAPPVAVSGRAAPSSVAYGRKVGEVQPLVATVPTAAMLTAKSASQAPPTTVAGPAGPVGKASASAWTAVDASRPTRGPGVSLARQDEVLGNAAIAKALREGVAFAAVRTGAAEVDLVRDHILKKNTYSSANAPHINSGIYPETQEGFVEFAQIYLGAIRALNPPDMYFSYSTLVDREDLFLPMVHPGVPIYKHRGLEPFYFGDSGWSRELKGKHVLVVHPFMASIKCQLKRRDKLFPSDPSYLEGSTFSFYKMPMALGPTPHGSWKETLEVAMAGIDAIGDFDVALIAAGAYALPLAVHCRSRVGESAQPSLTLPCCTTLPAELPLTLAISRSHIPRARLALSSAEALSSSLGSRASAGTVMTR